MEAAQLSTPAAQARPIYAEEIKKRFFADDKIMDRDLIVLCLNWPADLRATLGYDASMRV